MFENLKDEFIKFITSRAVIICTLVICFSCVLIYRLFNLQIVNGESYLDDYKIMITKKKPIPATRGNIYDRNENLLAYNDIANSVTIEDVYKSGKGRNNAINGTLNDVIDIIEKNNDHVDHDFDIILDDSNNYVFTSKDNERFLADIYGHAKTKDLEYEERIKTAEQVVDDLCKTFEIGEYEENGLTSKFIPRKGYSKDRALKLVIVRYKMKANSFQRYIDTTIASDVSDKTVADVMEDAYKLEGVSIEERTIRKYVDSEYFAHLLGYTGKVSDVELPELKKSNPDYDINDTVGKSGIEKSMESVLQGKKGSETVNVDNTGRVIETSNVVKPTAGNNVYLTIDKDLTEACYKIIEQSLAGIIVDKIRNVKEFDNSQVTSSSKIVIPIYDVYFSMFDNDVIDVPHLEKDSAKATEKAVYAKYLPKKESTINAIKEELLTGNTPYKDLPKEYQWYMSHIVSKLKDMGIYDTEKVDSEDATYKAWANDEVISLSEFLKYAIAMNWIDVSKLKLDNQYADSEEIYNQIVNFIADILDKEDYDFGVRLYKYLLLNGDVTGTDVCNILMEQGKVNIDNDEKSLWERGGESPYNFMIKRITNLDITPAQLALDPCSGSMVVTDVNTGDVLALVTYPGYDNNKMANGVDADYYSKLLSDNATPLINYATTQKTAPGSTFKMVSSTAGLMEGAITTESTIKCTGIFDKIGNPMPTCWNKGGHGSLNVVGGIKNSCNVFFYEVGYRLGLVGNSYDSDIGLAKLKKYADLYGLTECSGIEISESDPKVSDKDSVRSAIGQGTHNYTTVGLARYVTAVANSGTCYNLTLLNKTTDPSNNVLEEYDATVRNNIDMPSNYWNAIHLGMRQVVQSKQYYDNFGVNVAGKTGTAEESRKRPAHSLFVCYAPYEAPEIAIATRIAYGYTSTYAAQITKRALEYYFELEDRDELLSGTAQSLQDGGTRED